MIKWDIERLKEDADAFAITDILGIERRRKGSTTYIPCLSGEHAETDINHNQLFKNNCYCYSCGHRYNAYDMVKKYYENILGRSISLNDICEILVNTCGSRDSYISKKGKNDVDCPVLPLNNEELTLIGLAPRGQHFYNYEFIGHSEFKPSDREGKYISYRGEYIKVRKVTNQTLLSFYTENPDVCKTMFLEKAKEAINDCENQLTVFSGNDELSYVIRAAYLKKLAKVKEIYRRLGGILPKKANKIFHL